MPAPKGNSFSYNGGRPREYNNPEDMWNEAVEYFQSTMQKNGKYQPTIEGLTFALGFSSRQSLINYAQRDEVFLDVVNRAKTFIKSCYEKQLYGFAWAGAAFALKNIGKEDWKDEVTEHSDRKVTHVTIEEKKRED